MKGKAFLNVEDVIATDQLARRPKRLPDHARESRMLGALAAELAERPENLLQRMCDLIVEDESHLSAGISLDENVSGARRFRWVALSGAWGHLRGGTMPPDASPCGVVVARDEVMLFERPERAFAAARVEPLIREILLVPFHAEGRPVGTLWVNAHDPGRRFDREDTRLLQSVAHFASAGFQMERRVAERTAALQESEERLRLALDAGDMGTFAWHPREDRGEPDARMRALFGRPPEGDLNLVHALAGPICPDDGPRYAAAVARAVDPAGNGRLREDIRLVGPDGEPRWMTVAGQVRFDGDGPERMFGVAFEVTDRKRAEAALRASEERQAFLLRLSDALRAEPNAEAIANRALQMLLEQMQLDRCYVGIYRLAEDIGDFPHQVHDDRLPPLPAQVRLSDFPEALQVAFDRTLVVDDVVEMEGLSDGDRASFDGLGMRALIAATLRKGENNPLWAVVAVSTCPRVWTQGEVSLVEEVAERTWAAQAGLREGEERLRAIVETAKDYAILTTDPEGRVETWSRGAEEVLGWPADEIVGEMVDVTFTPEDRAEGAPEWERRTARDEGQAPDLRWHLRRDGSRVFIEGAVRPLAGPDGAPRGFVKVGQDVTERRATQEALRASEALFRQFAEASSDVLWIRDAGSLQFEYVSPAFEAIYGDTFERVFAGNDLRRWAKTILPEDRGRTLDVFRRVRMGQRVNHEFRIRRSSDGALRWIRDTDFPILGQEGCVERVAGIGQDVTELKRAEAAVAESEARLRILTEGIPQLVWRAVDHGEWTWASPQWTAFTGQAEAASHGWGWLDTLHPDDRQGARGAWERAKTTDEFEAEFRLREAATGEYRWFQTRATQVRDEVGRLVEWLGTTTDVQNLRALQDRQQVLVAELQHRTRNLMGVVRAIMTTTLRGRKSLDEFVPAYRDRLDALVRVNGLLSRLGEDDRITFDELIQAELGALGAVDASGQGDRVTLDGPRGVRLRSSTVQTFALALHELAINALKYGALKQPGGHLTVRWRRMRGGDEAPDGRMDGRTSESISRPRLRVEWTETGVPMPEPGTAPQGGGYGRELIERALPYQLKAETAYELGPDGVRCTITLPLSSTPELSHP